MRHKILLIGATGVFGQRLARHLVNWTEIELVLTSRSMGKAEAVARQLKRQNPDVELTPIKLDKCTDFERQLDTIKPFCVIDCSGPFQEAGHEAARQVLESGSHFIDLADAREYLETFSSNLDETTQQHSLTALAGASSTPALSGAVVAHLTQNWRRVDTIDICITPGGKSEVGQSVIAAILSYAGKLMPVWNEGKLSFTHGWLNSRTVVIPELGKRKTAPVDTVDASLLGNRYKVSSRVSFSAGLESRIEQTGIGFIALLVKSRLFRNIEKFIPLLLRARRFTSLFSGTTGAMSVIATGLNEENRLTSAQWTLLAKHDHGPFIPILPAASALRALVGKGLKPGAGLALDQLTLGEIEHEMSPYSISTQTDVNHLETGLFPAFFGTEKYAGLPMIVRALHDGNGPPVWEGEASVEMSNNILLKLIARSLGFPRSGNKIPLCVTIERKICLGKTNTHSETWTRNFSGRSFSSTLSQGEDGSFVEQFGPLSFRVGLDVVDGRLVMPVIGWWFGFIPLPSFLAPKSDASECEDEDGRFLFDVKLTLPIFGLFAHYSGWLLPKEVG